MAKTKMIKRVEIFWKNSPVYSYKSFYADNKKIDYDIEEDGKFFVFYTTTGKVVIPAENVQYIEFTDIPESEIEIKSK